MGSVENAHLLADSSAKTIKNGTVSGEEILGTGAYQKITSQRSYVRYVGTSSVTTKDNFINPKKKYLWGSRYRLNQMHLDGVIIYFMIKRGKITKWKKMTLKEKEVETWEESAEKTSGKDDVISFGLYEVWSGKWKGGIGIHHAFVKEI